LSPGKAYVRGFDVDLAGTTVLDVEKPRDIKEVKAASIPFEMGSVIKVNNVIGAPTVKIGGTNTNIVKLYNRRRSSTAINGLEIGEARVYSWGVSNAPYTGATTDWDLHLYDIQTYTILKCSAIPESKAVDRE